MDVYGNLLFGHFGGFQAGFDQISFDLVENTFARRQLAVLATSITLYDILAQACVEIKILDKKVTHAFRLFDF